MSEDSKTVKIAVVSKTKQLRITIEVEEAALTTIARAIADSNGSDVQKVQAILSIVDDMLALAEKPLRQALIERMN